MSRACNAGGDETESRNARSTVVRLSPRETELVAAAVQATTRAYAPYSRFPVGAALRAAGGQVFTGANVENASYGLTICAERVAILSAVAAGHRRFLSVAVAAGTSNPVAPCGACLQVMAEFMPRRSVVLLASRDGKKVRRTTLAQLLPQAFSLKRRPSTP